MTTCILFSEWNVVTFDTTPALPRPVLCRRWKLPCAEAGWGGAVPHQDHKCLQILLRQRPQHCQWIPWKRQGPEAWGEGKVRNFKCRFIHAGRVNSISNAFSFCVSPTGIFTPTLPRLWAPTLESWMIRFTTSFTPSSKWKKKKTDFHLPQLLFFFWQNENFVAPHERPKCYLVFWTHLT